VSAASHLHLLHAETHRVRHHHGRGEGLKRSAVKARNRGDAPLL